MTNKELFLAAISRKPVPFTSGPVSCQLRFVTAGEWAAWEAVKAANADANFAYWLVVRGVCDEAGERLFSDADMGTIDTWPLSVANDVAKRVQEMCGMKAEGDEGKA